MKKTETIEDPTIQRDVICAYLGRASTLWLEQRARAERADGLDANLNGIVKRHYKQIDALLAGLIEVPGVRWEDDGTRT